MKFKTATIAAVCLGIAAFVNSDLHLNKKYETQVWTEILWAGILGIEPAHAYNPNRGVARRTARRTARRVSHRHSHYYALPAGCTKVLLNGHWHHYCGGIYYLERIDQGKTIYVIVNP